MRNAVRIFYAAICLSSCLVCDLSLGADSPTSQLISHPDPVSLPSIGRVVFGFLLTVAIAVGAAYALRRWLPQLTKRYSSAPLSSLSSETRVQNGVRFHIVNVAGATVLVAEGKTGITMAVLPDKEKKDAMSSP